MRADRYIPNAIAFRRKLGRQLSHFKDEIGQALSDGPHYAGTGLIGEMVPPIAGTSLRTNVGSPSLMGYLFVADAWHSVLSRFLRGNSKVLDIGCGCGKIARTLVYHPYIAHYIGFDVIRENVDWCERSIVPTANGRFEFHYLDVFSGAYNPAGKLKGTDVVFPLADGSIDFAFAGSPARRRQTLSSRSKEVTGARRDLPPQHSYEHVAWDQILREGKPDRRRCRVFHQPCQRRGDAARGKPRILMRSRDIPVCS
jgi:SAM-dependent methyltransferase